MQDAAQEDVLTASLAKVAECIAGEQPGYARLADAFVERLERASAGAGAPGIGDVFPDFVLPSIDGELVVASELLAGPSVVASLRGHWCPFSVALADAIRAAVPELTALGVGVVFISPERAPFAMKSGRGEDGVTVLCDMDNGLAASLGLMAVLDDLTVEFLRSEGDDLPLYQGNNAWTVPIPATFVLAPGRVIAERVVGSDFRRRMAISSLVAAAHRVTRGQASVTSDRP